MKVVKSDRLAPMNGRVLVKAFEDFQESTRESGIIVLSNADKDSYYRIAEVVAVDKSDKRNAKIDPGGAIIFDRFYKEELGEVLEQDVMMIRREDVCGVIRNRN